MAVAQPCCFTGVTADDIGGDQPPGPRRLDAKAGKAPYRVVLALISDARFDAHSPGAVTSTFSHT